MKPLYFLAPLLLLSVFSHAQYTQNFDTLVNSGSGLYTIYHEGWGIYEVGSGAAADGKYAVGTGSSNTGNAYSFGTAGSPERALGTVASGTNFPTVGVIFFNEVDSVLTTITVSYTGEQWRYGGRTTGTKDTLRFEYSLDATGIVNNQGTWVRVKPLDFLSVNVTGTTAQTLDGNAAINRQAISYQITGLNLQPGESIVLRWSDFDIASNDDGLAIDDFSISKGLSPGVMTSGGTNVGGGTGGGGGTNTGTSTSVPLFENKVAIDSGFITLYGNLHGHSTHSDGRASTGEPVNDYTYAMAAQGMDFLGISEHNHYTAGLHIADYKKGAIQADTMNAKLNLAGHPFITLHGMEWGTISGGGHALVYGYADSLLGWESGTGSWGPTNNYDVYVPKSDYITLFDKVRNFPGAVALLAHPQSGDYSGLTGGYKGVADSAVVSVAIESGPAFSTTTTYSDFPSSLAYLSYYRNLLKQGYRIGAHMDQDNHELTFGTANANRMVVLSKDRTREGLLSGIRAMRIYASNDYNATVNFTIGGYILGSSIVSPFNLTGLVTYSDGNGEGISTLQVWGGRVRGADATLIHSATANTTFTTAQADGDTWYYYVIITQMDGNKNVTSPIWVTKASAIPLPVTLLDFTATGNTTNGVTLNWHTGAELNSHYFVVERSTSLTSFDSISIVMARGTGFAYSLIDNSPVKGMNFYRLKQVDKDGHVTYSKIVSVNLAPQYTVTLSPNPSKGVVTIKNNLPAGGPVTIQVIDVAGNRVYNKVHTASTQISADLSHLPNGFYIVRVGDEIKQLVIAK